MKHLWIRIRMPLAVILLLVITLAMARLFSGPEDTWIKNEQGEWIKHGYPSGPPPAQDYRKPITYTIFPIFFLAAFAVPLFFIKFHKLHNRLIFETASRDIKFFGYVSTALFIMGFLTGAGLIAEICMAEGGGEVQLPEFLVIVSIGGFAGTRWWSSPAVNFKAFRNIQIALVLFIIVFSFNIFIIKTIKIPFWFTQVKFTLLTFIAGFIGGAQFPVAATLWQGTSGKVGKTAGLLYGVDLIGSCIGALLCSTILIPLAGVPMTLVILGCISFGSLLVILASENMELL